jgi:hypothetical protein
MAMAMLATMPAANTSPAQMSPNAPEACARAGDRTFKRSCSASTSGTRAIPKTMKMTKFQM